MSEIIITSEMKEDAKKCNGKSCNGCKMYSISKGQSPSVCVEALSSLPGVWDQAPEKAIEAYVNFGYSSHMAQIMDDGIKYTRTLPKSLEDEIAEKYSFDTPICHPMINGMRAINVIKSALKEYNERQGGK